MWEIVVSALLIHLGKKGIDKFWPECRSGKHPVISQTGNLGYAFSDAGLMQVGKELTVSQYQEYQTLVGNLYIPDTIQNLMVGDEVVLVLVIEETNQEVFLFEADVEGYKVDLPHGVYSIFVFIVDARVEDLFDALIYAVGFPCAEDINLSDKQSISVDNHEDIWDLIDETPIEITRGGPFYLNFILIDTDEVPEFPQFFSEFLEDESVGSRGSKGSSIHNFVDGVCTKCGCSKEAVDYFGWKCDA
jgi:hypothetical protein